MSTQPVVRRRREQKILVFNPTIFTDYVQIGGVTYHFEPGGFATCACAHHNLPGQEDNVGVHASYEHARDKRDVIQWQAALKVGGDGELTADKCAEVLVSPDCRGGKFFVIVEGTEQQRKAIMRQARESWSLSYGDEVDQMIQQWERDCRELQLSQPGALPPRQSQRIKDAYAFRKVKKSNLDDRTDFVCLTCGHDAESKEELDQHVREDHPGIAADRGLAVAPPRVAAPVAPLAERVAATRAKAATEPEGEPEPELPLGEGAGAEVQPPAEEDTPDDQDEQETGEVVMRRAKRTGVELSPADLRALAQDDPESIADVQKRIRDLRTKRAELVKEQQARRRGAPAPAQ